MDGSRLRPLGGRTSWAGAFARCACCCERESRSQRGWTTRAGPLDTGGGDLCIRAPGWLRATRGMRLGGAPALAVHRRQSEPSLALPARRLRSRVRAKGLDRATPWAPRSAWVQRAPCLVREVYEIMTGALDMASESQRSARSSAGLSSKAEQSGKPAFRWGAGPAAAGYDRGQHCSAQMTYRMPPGLVGALVGVAVRASPPVGAWSGPRASYVAETGMGTRRASPRRLAPGRFLVTSTSRETKKKKKTKPGPNPDNSDYTVVLPAENRTLASRCRTCRLGGSHS